MKHLVKYLLRFHRETVLNGVVADYFGEIPLKVSEESINILQEKRPRLDRWISYQAFHLQRRLKNDPKMAEVMFGMLLQLRLTSHMLSGGRPTPEEEDTKPASLAQAERERQEELQKAITGTETFKKGKKK